MKQVFTYSWDPCSFYWRLGFLRRLIIRSKLIATPGAEVTSRSNPQSLMGFGYLGRDASAKFFGRLETRLAAAPSLRFSANLVSG